MNLFGLTARVLAGVLVFGVLTPILPANAVPSSTTAQASIERAVSTKVAPKNTTAPTISGTAKVPNSLSVTNGTWSGVPTSYTYQWFRCTAAIKKAAATAGASCSAIGSATSSSYALTNADVGKFMMARVSGVNVSGTVPIHTVSTAAVVAQFLPPVNSVAPLVTGSPVTGSTLSVSTGTWTENPTSYVYKWFRCTATQVAANAKPAVCTEIVGESNATYTLVTADATRFIVASVTATNAGSSVTKWSASTTAIVVPSRPANTVAPTVTGTATNSMTLTASTGTWSSFPASYSYQWVRCTTRITLAANALPGGCTEISGERTSTYVLVDADVAKFVGVAVTATNAIGSVSKWSITTAAVAALPAPANTVTPAVSGSAQVSRIVTLSDGTWTFRPSSYSYKWYSCTAAKSAGLTLPTGCTQIPGATGATFQLLAGQQARFVLGMVTATNRTGSAVRYTATTAAVTVPAPYAPSAFVRAAVDIGGVSGDAISGRAMVGSVLVADEGTWLGYPIPVKTFSYWYRCASQVINTSTTQPAGCYVIDDSEGDTNHVVTLEDLGSYLLYEVIATNTQGVVRNYTPSTSAITATPVAYVQPSLTGNAGYNSSLEMDEGAWATPPSVGVDFDYSWYRCETDSPMVVAGLPVECELIDGETRSSYSVSQDDLGFYVFGAVTALNDFDESASAIAGTRGMSTATPELSSTPTVSGTRVSGNDVTVDDADYVAYPEATVSLQWLRCMAAVTTATSTLPGTCAAIAGETGQSYTLVDADLGRFITARTTITNTLGTLTTIAASTVAVGSVPVFTVSPAVTGTTIAGSTLTVSTGTATGSPTPTRAYQWLRCSAAIDSVVSAVPETCAIVSGATSPTYVTTTGDTGKRMAVRVIATNAIASTTTVTLTTAEIDSAPSRLTAPALSGTRTQGQELSVSDGTWTAHPTPSVTYQWVRCTAAVPANTFALPATCVNISSATTSTYTSTADDLGKFVTAVVTATNSRGAIATVAPSATAIASLPATVATPLVSGTATRGSALSTAQIAWTGTPTPSLSLQWYGCMSAVDTAATVIPDGCALISGATSANYTIVEADAGKYVTVASVATNVAGTSRRIGLSSTIVQSLPSIVVAPTITGDRWLGSELTVADGQWFEYPVATVTYQWYRCSSPVTAAATVPAHCSESITGATSNKYTLDGTDAGKYLTVVVEHTNSLGTTRHIAAQSIATFLPPSIDTDPTLTGTASLGSKLTLDPGLWTGYPAPTTSLSWLICSEQHESASTLTPGDCSIDSVASSPGLTYQSYLIPTNSSVVPTRSDLTYTKCSEGAVSNLSQNWGDGVVAGCRADYVMVHYAGFIKSATTQTLNTQVTLDDGFYMTLGSNVVFNRWGLNGGQTVSGSPITLAAGVAYPIDVWYYEAWGGAVFNVQTAVGSVYSSIPDSYLSTSSRDSNKLQIETRHVGKFISGRVVATNSGSATTWMSPTTVAVTAPPTPTTNPSTSGTRLVGQTLTMSPGVFVEYPASDSVAYKWYRCSAAIGATTSSSDSCYRISGESDLTYTQTADDAGYYISGSVTRTNSIASVTAWSAASATTNQAPVVVIDGFIDGDPIAGTSLNASEGQWQGFPVPSLQFQWYRCSTAVTSVVSTVPAGCATIAAATTSNYLLAPADMGHHITFAVTRGNTLGTVTRVAQSTAVVTGVPVVVTAPAVSGTRVSGSVLTVSAGTWLAHPSANTTRQWYRCASTVAVTESAPSGCNAIDGETGLAYTQTFTDAGKYVTATTTQTNANGAKTVWAAASLTSNYPPTLVTEPTISGTPSFNSTLTAGTGEWRGFPTPTPTYQWYRCTAAVAAEGSTVPAGCDVIATSGSSATYTAVGPDMGKFLVARVTQTNSVSATVRFTRSTEVVSGPPAAQISPEIAGIRRMGQSLSVTDGTWWAYPAISDTSYQWYRCSAAISTATPTLPGTCAEIEGESSSDYELIAADSGSFVTAKVSRTNSVGASVLVASQTTASTQLPTNTTAPSITGTINMGELLTVSDGEWQGFPRPTYSYEWFECSGEVAAASSTRPSGCTEFQSDAKISAGSTHSCVAQADGTAYCWGVSSGTFSTSTPTAQSGSDKIVQVASGNAFTCYVLVDSSAKCFGANGSGQVGDGTTTTRATPVATSGLRGVRSIDAGDAFACALLIDGTVKCWGNNGSGQLGLGNTTSQSTPQVVPGLTNVISLDAGQNHTCAVISGGTVKCWGLGGSGQIGNGATTNQSAPTAVSAITTAVSVSAGGSHTCAVLTTGGVRCWGLNASGQLGNASSTSTSSPVGPLNMTTGAASVSAGSNHTCVAMSDGTGKCWGSNISGQLGTGNLNASTVPATVPSLSGISNVSAGVSHTCVSQKSGSVSCWGLNTSGQIGDGTTTSPRTTATLRTFNLSKILLNEPEFGKRLVAAVAASNTVGAATRYSASANLVTSRPVVLATPSISSGANHGLTLTVANGSWASSSAITGYEYQWYRCATTISTFQTSVPSECEEIVNAATPTYVLAADDAGKHVAAKVTAIASSGRTSITTASNGPITVAPIRVSRPTISATPVLGATVAANTGEWKGYPNLTVNHQWYRCESPVGDNVSQVPQDCLALAISGSIETGVLNSCVVEQSGFVYCWGDNSYGQLGTGTNATHAAVPARVDGVTQSASVSLGDGFVCSVSSMRTVSCWGNNDFGQLGRDYIQSWSAPAIAVTGISDVVQISAGNNHACARKSTGSLSCWGKGTAGQLGNGGGYTSYDAVTVGALGSGVAVDVSAGSNHTCAVNSLGSVYCWGSNSNGELGNGTTTNRSTPGLVSGVTNAIKVSAGNGYTCALITGGTVKCWGYGSDGRLGHGLAPARATTAVTVSGITSAVTITTGNGATCATLSDRTLRCWGYNGFGQLGNNSIVNQSVPVTVVGVSGVSSVSAGDHHTCAQIAGRSLQCWGRNNSGQLGNGNTNTLTTAAIVNNSLMGSAEYQPTAEDVAKYLSIAVTASNEIGSNFSMSVTPSAVLGAPTPRTAPQVTGVRTVGSLLSADAGVWVEYPVAAVTYQWYRCDSAVATHSTSLPSQCSAIDGETAQTYSQVDLDAGKFVTVRSHRENTAGAVDVWSVVNGVTNRAPTASTAPTISGSNALGSSLTLEGGTWRAHPTPTISKSWYACDSGAGQPQTVPADCEVVPIAGAEQISTGGGHTCAVIDSGGIACWGDNQYGQLGIGSTVNQNSPSRVAGITDAAKVSAGAGFTCAVDRAERLYCWGSNEMGRLGDGTVVNRTSPVLIRNSGIVDVSAGWGHTCALTSSATVLCWGHNEVGQLGLGNRDNKYTPTAVPGLSNVVSISTGEVSTCAVLASGVVKCWGVNESGNLGDGTTTERLSPVSTAGISNAVKVSMSWRSTCALLATGEVNCWGNNAEGRLGDGTTTHRLVPVAVSGVSNAVSVSIYDAHGCAVLADGTAKCWGKNFDGALGNGSTTYSTIPVTAVAGTKFTAVTAGRNHSCGIKEDGGLICWGTNGYGQLGNGTNSASLSGTVVASGVISSRAFPITEALVGKFLLGSVRASNSLGESTQFTDFFGPVSGKPAITSTMSVTGNRNTTGQTITASSPTFRAVPAETVTSHQWYRCTSPVTTSQSLADSGCQAIVEATSPTYVLSVADEGRYVTVEFTAVNAAGTSKVWAVATDKVFGRTTITTSGSWTVPAGVYSADVLVVGGGGNGASASGVVPGGAGGGAEVVYARVALEPGETKVIEVGAKRQWSRAFGLVADYGRDGLASPSFNQAYSGGGYSGNAWVDGGGGDGGGLPTTSDISGISIAYGGGGFRSTGSATGSNGSLYYGFGGGGGSASCSGGGCNGGSYGGRGVVVIRWISGP